MRRPKPVILAVVSGFGIGPAQDQNAIRQAHLPFFDQLTETYPAIALRAAGDMVGKEEASIGTPEAGHRTIGAGRVIYESVPRIRQEIATGRFYTQPTLRNTCRHVVKRESTLHLIGMLSAAEQHARRDHLEALLELAKREGVARVALHLVLDGIDTPSQAALTNIRSLEEYLTTNGIGTIASLCGRRWAMDPSGLWDRIEACYRAMAQAEGPAFPNATDALESSYAKRIFDDELHPCVILQRGGATFHFESGDACIFFNTLPAPKRRLVQAFTLPSFSAFDRPKTKMNRFVTLTEYDKDLPVQVAYPPLQIDTTLGSVISEAGLTQLRIAETEGFAHLTYDLNGMREESYPGEERVLIPSPQVSRYEQVPEMRTQRIADRVVKEIAQGIHDVMFVEFSAPDLIAMTGDEMATIRACEVVDRALGKIADATLAVGGALLVTSDHGHAEAMRDPATDRLNRIGTRNPVPFLVVGRAFEGLKAPRGDMIGGDLASTAALGSLSDIAPTMLQILGLRIPKEMTGHPLI
ncbi:2,3-bisphosphoglycerate-independent phosphoglycerate mutase [Candidatus Uhrbacteria bacterium]|nr:2,3-bisphosphoglycerate-independent phosphoglycerate mutase [Candidatus Uhrbacteria bacterium]MBD3284075.1 2,3-bisphosphoglycerate-independent phosphoglycerate mutase [Candidatus Uhrbacteria bacterium]